MAKKNQGTEEKIASLKEEIERLRNENHNLKRKVKRMEARKESDKAEAERIDRTEEVTKEGMDDIKKKLKAAGLNDRTSEVFNFVFPFLGLEVPSYVTVREWVLKAGLDTYVHRCKDLPVEKACAIVMDESITIAEHKILLGLKIPAQHPGKPITHSDVDYLMPCNMRALARYMNVFNWIRWAKNMMEATGKLSSKERKMYSFVWKHGSLVEELQEVAECYEKVLSVCKSKGLSFAMYKECADIIKRSLMGRGHRLTRLAEMLLGYFRRETTLLKTAEESHNVSSDIIESTFGYFKERKSDNRMYGVTGFVMVLPLHTKLSTLEAARNFDFKGCLERTHNSDLRAWKKQNLPENLAAKRARILGYVA